jgi:hypothetical protein
VSEFLSKDTDGQAVRRRRKEERQAMRRRMRW